MMLHLTTTTGEPMSSILFMVAFAEVDAFADRITLTASHLLLAC